MVVRSLSSTPVGVQGNNASGSAKIVKEFTTRPVLYPDAAQLDGSLLSIAGSQIDNDAPKPFASAGQGKASL